MNTIERRFVSLLLSAFSFILICSAKPTSFHVYDYMLNGHHEGLTNSEEVTSLGPDITADTTIMKNPGVHALSGSSDPSMRKIKSYIKVSNSTHESTSHTAISATALHSLREWLQRISSQSSILRTDRSFLEPRTSMSGSVLPVLDGLLTLLGYLAFATFAAITLLNIINNAGGGGRALRGAAVDGEVAMVLRRAGKLVSEGARLVEELSALVIETERSGVRRREQ